MNVAELLDVTFASEQISISLRIKAHKTVTNLPIIARFISKDEKNKLQANRICSKR